MNAPFIPDVEGFDLPIATLRTRRRLTPSWLSPLCFGIAIGIFGTGITLTDPAPKTRCVYQVVEATP